MKLTYSTKAEIAQKYRQAVQRLINDKTFVSQSDALRKLRIRATDWDKEDWTPSKSNVVKLVKNHQVNAFHLYFKEPVAPVFQFEIEPEC